MNTIAVTGAQGFIGSHLVRALQGAGSKVIALGRRPQGAGDVRVMACDVTDPQALAAALAGATAAVHLAAILREDGGTFREVNIGGTQNVVEGCRAAGVGRLIHVSAQGADPRSPSRFLRSKAEGEEVVRASGLRWTVLRPSLVLGPGCGYAERLLEAIQGRGRVPVVGSGRNLVQPVHVADLVDVILICLQEAQTEGKVLEVGGPERVPLGHLTLTIARAAGHRGDLLRIPAGVARVAALAVGMVSRDPPITGDEVAMMVADNVCDTAELEALGFRPRRGLEAMVKDSVAVPASRGP
jgi:NADH dehydrogenase